MRFNLTDEIEFPLELVYDTHRDKLEDILSYLPNIENIEILEKRVEGEVTRFVKRWTGSNKDVPSVVRPLLKPEYLQWIDRATWDRGRFTTDWELELGVLPGAISAKGHNRFIADGDITLIEMEGEFVIHPERLTFVPQIVARKAAPVLERFIVAQVKPNLRGTNEAIQRFLEARQG